jgi:hypothetical protein
MKSLFIIFALIYISNCSITRIAPIADSWLNSYYPSTNYGSAQIGYCYNDAVLSASYDLVVMFNISTVPSTLNSASIVYTQDGVDPNEAITGPQIEFELREVSTNWTESLVTWSNPPTHLSTILANYQDNDIDYIIAPVTSIVNSYKASSKSVIAFRLAGSYPFVPIYMREYSSDPGFRPVLEVNF